MDDSDDYGETAPETRADPAAPDYAAQGRDFPVRDLGPRLPAMSKASPGIDETFSPFVQKMLLSFPSCACKVGSLWVLVWRLPTRSGGRG